MGLIHFKFAGVIEGRKIIKTKDTYINNMAPHERSLKLVTNRTIDEHDFLAFLETTVLPWEPEEQTRLEGLLNRINGLLSPYPVNPDYPIHLVKTDGRDEWHSAYTRENSIFLPPRKIDTYDDQQLTKLILHEICHVLLRFDGTLKKQLYAMIGFMSVEPITLPESLSATKLTNPDAPHLNCSIMVHYQGEERLVTPVIFLKQQLKQVDALRDILDSITMKLMVVEETNGQIKPVLSDRSPILISQDAVTGYLEKTGRNTGDLSHPEEILAENFVLAILEASDVPNPEIPDQFRKILRQHL